MSPRKPSSPYQFLSEMLSLILLENSFQFNEKDYLQTRETTMKVSMGLTDRRKTAKNLVDSRKNGKILTVSRK